MIFSVLSDLLSLIDDNNNITTDGSGSGGGAGGGTMNGQSTMTNGQMTATASATSTNRNQNNLNLKKKSYRSMFNIGEKMDLMSILINSSSGTWTISQMIEAIRYYVQDLQRLPERIEKTKELANEIHTCYRCVQPCTAETVHYVCSHCHEVILCEQCEQRSEELHPFDFIKIKPKSLNSNNTITNPIVKATRPAIEMFRKNLILLLGELQRDLSIAEDCYEQYTPGTRFTKIWHIGNNGNFDWPTGTELRCLGSNIDPIDGKKSIPLSLQAGEQYDIQMDFMIPANVCEEKIFYSVWRFWHDGQYFGQTIQMRVKAVPNVAQIEKFGEKTIVAISDADDDDDVSNDIGRENDKDDEKVIMFTPEMIPYPDCFNLTIPFVKHDDQDHDDTDDNTDVIGSSQNIVNHECDNEQSEQEKQQQQQQQQEPEQKQQTENKEKKPSLKKKTRSNEREPLILQILRSQKTLDNMVKASKERSSIIMGKQQQHPQKSKSIREPFPFQFPATSAMIDIANRMINKHHHSSTKSPSSSTSTTTNNERINQRHLSTGMTKTIKIRRRNLVHSKHNI